MANMVLCKGNKIKQYLYNAGNEFTAFTGGWTTSIYAWNNAYGTGLAPTLTKGANNMRCYLSATGTTRSGSVFPIKPIAVDNYTKLCIQIKSDIPNIQYGNAFACLIAANPASANYAASHVVYAPNTIGKGEYIATFDIVDLTGNYYLALSIIAYYVSANYTSDVYIEKVWLE